MATNLPAPAAALLNEIEAWAGAGVLRRLDAAFAAFALELDPSAAPETVLAAALVAHLEGLGHGCLDLDDLLADGAALLGWAAPAAVRLQATLRALPRSADAWRAVLRSSPLVALDEPGAAGASGSPLVLRGSRLYLRRLWACERVIAEQVHARNAGTEAVDTAAARHWLDRLFAPAPPSAEAAFDWQKAACAIALRGRLTVVTGGPGTGKTHTAARLLALLFALEADPARLRVALAAPTGKAAGRLEQSIRHALAELGPALEGHALGAAGLAARIGSARTLHALLGARPDTRRFAFDAANPLPLDLLLVDEASMIHLEMMAALLAALAPGARLVLLGDRDQLASVEAGAVLGDLCRGAEQGRYSAATGAYLAATTGRPPPAAALGDGPALAQQTVMLRHSHRFGGPIGALARAANAGDAAAAAALLRAGGSGGPIDPFPSTGAAGSTGPTGSAGSNGPTPPPAPGAAPARIVGAELLWLEAAPPAAAVELALAGRAGAEGGYRSYLELIARRSGPMDAEAHAAWARRVLEAFERFRLLCALREGKWGAAGLNLAVERALAAARLIAPRGPWYEGRPVMVTRNDAGLGVFNGDIGIVLRPPDPAAPLRLYLLEGAGLRSVGVSRLGHASTAFALTVHKAQGSEFEHTALVLPAQASRVLTRELVYTGITRARRAFTLVSGRGAALAEALASRTRRSSGLVQRLAQGDADPG